MNEEGEYVLLKWEKEEEEEHYVDIEVFMSRLEVMYKLILI